MTLRTTIVFSCDKNFFGLLKEFIQSIEHHKKRNSIEYSFLNIDLEEEQRDWLLQYTNDIVYPEWDIHLPSSIESDRRFLSLLSRPFIPQYFPDFDIYLYMDVDVWVQDWRGIELYIEGASRGSIAVTPGMDRSYYHSKELLDYRHRMFSQAFGEDVAQDLLFEPYMNAGIFALKRDAPHWTIWAEYLQKALNNGALPFGSDQSSLNYAIRKEQLPFELLPATCNWQCHLALPIYDEAKRQFCEPYLPNDKIFLLHLTADTKHKEQSIKTLSGNTLMTSLRYSNTQHMIE